MCFAWNQVLQMTLEREIRMLWWPGLGIWEAAAGGYVLCKGLTWLKLDVRVKPGCRVEERQPWG